MSSLTTYYLVWLLDSIGPKRFKKDSPDPGSGGSMWYADCVQQHRHQILYEEHHDSGQQTLNFGVP